MKIYFFQIYACNIFLVVCNTNIMNTLETQLEELKKDFAEIKSCYAVYTGDLPWRYSYKFHWRGYDFTHVYCNHCKYLSERDTHETTDCFEKHHSLINLIKQESKFHPNKNQTPKRKRKRK